MVSGVVVMLLLLMAPYKWRLGGSLLCGVDNGGCLDLSLALQKETGASRNSNRTADGVII
jgi:hypothetical protein